MSPVTTYEIKDDQHVTLYDLDPMKRWIIRASKAFIRLYRLFSKGKSLEDHVRYSSDPVAQILYEALNETISQYHDPHAVDALQAGSIFTIYISSTDSVYRPGRDDFLARLIDPERLKRLQAALDSEDEHFHYRDPGKWYANMKIHASKVTEEKRQRGLIRTRRGRSAEEVAFMDDVTHEQYKKQLNERVREMEET